MLYFPHKHSVAIVRLSVIMSDRATRAYCVFIRTNDDARCWWQSEPLVCTSAEELARCLFTEPAWFQLRDEPLEQWLAYTEDDAVDASRFLPGTIDWARLWMHVLRAAAPGDADACTLQLERARTGAPFIILEEDACGAPTSATMHHLSLGRSAELDVEELPFAQPQLTWQVVINAAEFASLLQRPDPNWKLFERIMDASGHCQWQLSLLPS